MTLVHQNNCKTWRSPAIITPLSKIRVLFERRRCQQAFRILITKRCQQSLYRAELASKSFVKKKWAVEDSNLLPARHTVVVVIQTYTGWRLARYKFFQHIIIVYRQNLTSHSVKVFRPLSIFEDALMTISGVCVCEKWPHQRYLPRLIGYSSSKSE